ncbi:MAG TPA: S-methyl-5-thioribose-1-phosphate isomerase [Dehalococcoidia bacterium]|nr:S-methyl-5-thioribose-1-phosphate isomerase [Dehalococcoidia bacterium]
MPQPAEWRDGALRFIDQAALPHDLRITETRDWREVRAAIARLAVRGAPLIGIAGAYGVALAARAGDDVPAAAEALASARPTAVNLRWAVERALAAWRAGGAPGAEAEALQVHDEQRQADAAMGELGAALLPDPATVLTHCNAGALATGGIGTALGVVKTAHRQGKRVRALVDETRPLLQGARLTTWELAHEGVPHELIVDAAAAGLIARGEVDAVLVGADRIAANGDTANKVGTYALALAAQAHGAPFYVVAPLSTVDARTGDGAAIPVEQREPHEVLSFAGAHPAPEATQARNPAFDVTPAQLITAIVTERGVLRPPFAQAIAVALGPAPVVAR